MKNDNHNKILMLLPTDDDKWVVGHAVIEDKDVETLEDCIFELAEQNGVKPNMKFPIVLVRDILKLRDKLLLDIDNILVEYSAYFDEEKYWRLEVEARANARKKINERFGVDE